MVHGGDRSRDPCPYSIINDAGGAFAMGAVGGAIWHSVKGARNAPRGERLMGSLAAVKARAPVLGGNFGVCGLYGGFTCAVQGYREQEDGWNSIIAGFFTGGTLAIRNGPAPALFGGVLCAGLMGLIEGANVVISRFQNEGNRPIMPAMPEQAAST